MRVDQAGFQRAARGIGTQLDRVLLAGFFGGQHHRHFTAAAYQSGFHALVIGMAIDRRSQLLLGQAAIAIAVASTQVNRKFHTILFDVEAARVRGITAQPTEGDLMPARQLLDKKLVAAFLRAGAQGCAGHAFLAERGGVDQHAFISAFEPLHCRTQCLECSVQLRHGGQLRLVLLFIALGLHQLPLHFILGEMFCLGLDVVCIDCHV